MLNKEHVLLCIMGRTASGKDSIANLLCNRTGMRMIVSYTTRPRRDNEEDTHIFATDEDYEQMKSEGIIAAYTEIAGNKYWTTINQLYENDVYIIDPFGVKVLKDLNLPDIRLVSIYINTPDEVRMQRALNLRGDDKSSFRTRDFSESSQFRQMLRDANFDYAVSNIELPKAYSTIRWIAELEGATQNNRGDNNDNML